MDNNPRTGNEGGYKILVAFTLMAMGMMIMWRNEIRQNDIAYLLSLLFFALGTFLSRYLVLRTNATRLAKTVTALGMALANIVIILAILFVDNPTLMMSILAVASFYFLLTQLELATALSYGNLELSIKR